MREMRGMLAYSKAPETVTLGDLKQRFEMSFFNRCVDAVMTSRADWEEAYTGRKFNSPIKGGYNSDLDDTSTLRFEIDMQETAQVHHEVLDASSMDETTRMRVFEEYLVKIAAKKKPAISTADGSAWRVGRIIPSPLKDEKGETVWYRADQAIDSAHGKLWYVFKSANDNASGDFPVFRVMRDTCRQKSALRAGPTISRDLAKNAGYKYSNSTELEDRAFFDQYTLPVWMGYLFAGVNKQASLEERVNSLQTATDEFMEELARRFSNNALTPDEIENYKEKLVLLAEHKNAFFKNPNETRIQNYIDYLKKHASRADRNLFEKLLQGKKPPSVVSAETSLGGVMLSSTLLNIQPTATAYPSIR